MGIEFVIKIAAIGIIVGVLNQVLTKSGKEEYAMATTIAGLILVIAMILPKIGALISELKGMFGI
ncbi:MAG: Stage III sporulation protein AC/AD protein family protein [Firmicutes bacterium ADurb.Bin300]|jgi:stage III sporulation protein AC|nr:MAG: Stage III sporulation protein AC/AD protein family protein [Firmicutes bacterium ADurb.Bin300]HOD02929.1 stage III sporulation protein AC [Clostridiales bacterium]